MAILLIATAGCESGTSAEAELQRRVDADRHRQLDPGVVAMKPMLGLWSVDVDATLAANTGLPAEFRREVEEDLRAYPFELQITDRKYVSRSWTKTIEDNYKVVDVDAHGVTIELTTPGGNTDEFPSGRRVKLRLENNTLYINTGGPAHFGFTRTRMR